VATRKALEELKEDKKITTVVACNLALGVLALEKREEEQAMQNFRTCVEAFKDWEFTTTPLHHVEALANLAAIHARHGNVEQARNSIQWAKRLAETLKSDAGLALASQAEAGHLLATGDSKGAEEAFRKSLALWEKAGWPYYHARALVAYSEAITQTKLDESRKRLVQAVEIFMKLGAKQDLEKAEAKLSVK
jgi:tetratricopeptide (TPR) repeat protein